MIEIPPKFDLWLPPNPAIIRRADRAIEKANFLPGMFPAGATKRGTPILALRGSATSQTSTITIPATTGVGDLIVFYQFAYDAGGAVPNAIPSGFTQASTISFANGTMTISYKIATSLDAGANITGMTVPSIYRNTLHVFSGNIIAAAHNTFSAQLTYDNPTEQTVNASAGTPPLVVIGAYSGSGATDPRTFTVGGSAAKDGEINSGSGTYLAYKIYNSAPQNVVVDMDDEGNYNTIQSGFISVS